MFLGHWALSVLMYKKICTSRWGSRSFRKSWMEDTTIGLGMLLEHHSTAVLDFISRWIRWSNQWGENEDNV